MSKTEQLARPESVDALQDIILEANADALAIDVAGGGSKALIGDPGPGDVALSTRGFGAVVDYDPAELVLTAGAGVSLAEIEALLDASGQMLAFEPMDYAPLLGAPTGQATLGGVLAANVSGPRRLTAGAARDHFIGLAAVSGRGDMFKAGGRVVKNVTGYDLPKLLGGSWGTLAVLTEVSVKVMPKPRSSATLVTHGLSDETAAQVMSGCLGAPLCVSAAAHFPAGLAANLPGLEGASGAVTLLRLEGVAPSIASSVHGAYDLAGWEQQLGEAETAALWRAIRDVAPFAGGEDVVWRISAPPADGWRIVAALSSLGGRAFYDWAGGLIWLSLPPANDAHAPAVRRAVAVFSGHATLIRASPLVRAAVAVFQPEAPALAALTARVKAAFDPAGVLNPGRRLAGA
ncbi:glycolate oxidase subunit GlcE [soil metagenome]